MVDASHVHPQRGGQVKSAEERRLPLFRPEAIDAISQQGTMGNASIYQPARLIVLTAFVGCLTALGIVYLFLADYPRRVAVRGYLVADGALSYLYARRDGLVAEPLVTEGTEVDVGQPLLRLAFPSELSSGADLNQLVRQELDYRIELLSGQLDGTSSEFEHARNVVADTMRRSREEMAQLGEMEDLRLRQLQLAIRRYRAVKGAHDKRAVSASRLLDERAKLYDLRTAYLSRRQQRLAMARVVAGYQNEVRRLHIEQSKELRRINLEISNAREQHAHIRFAAEMTVDAPVAGVVGGFQFRAGESVRQGDLLLAIDDGNDRSGILHVPDGAAALVPEGTNVTIIFDAYPVAKYGKWTGTIESMTNVPIAPELLQGPLVAKEPAYIAKVRIDGENVIQPELRLLAGMQYTAHVVLESRTVGEWLFEPIMELLKTNEAPRN